MKLHIPEQIEPAKNALPDQPRKLKKYLATLPNANMGELTRQVYQILHELNRQPMPIKYRFKNMEMLRQPAREIFNNLKKYFINRTIPLPEKSKKIVNLNQSLLQEMAYGYKIILLDIENTPGESKPDIKLSATTCCRTIRYLAELLLRSSEIYASPVKNLWLDIHQVYLFAERHQLLDIDVFDDDLSDTEREVKKIDVNLTDVNLCYKQILLFSLAQPATLSQSDSERLFHQLPQWANYSKITNRADPSQIDKIFCIKTNCDIQPEHLNSSDLETSQRQYFLNTEPLVMHIKKIIHKLAGNTSELTIGNQLPPASLKLISHNWSSNTKRRFSRARHKEKIETVIGLKNIVNAMFAKNKKAKGVNTRSGIVRTEQTISQDPVYTLEAMTDNNATTDLSGYITHSEINTMQTGSWDMVARGTALTDTYIEEQNKLAQEIPGQHKNCADAYWEIVNFSAGGYCLHWNSDEASRAQIGEIIALYEQINNEKYAWRIGTIRWMQFTLKNGLETGVQVISPKVTGATAQRIHRLNELPFECLMIPGIKPLKQASSIILPAHAFKSNDKLIVNISGNKLAITVGDVSEHTGSFTQFYYTNTDVDKRTKKQAKKELASKTQDNFDEIWSSL